MSALRKTFRSLLLLYPPAYRAQFGREMTELFELRLMACGNRAGFVVSELAGLIAGAAREWFAPRGEPYYAGTDFADRSLPKPVVNARLRVDDAVRRMARAISRRQFEEARKLASEEQLERRNLRRLCEDYGIDSF